MLGAKSCDTQYHGLETSGMTGMNNHQAGVSKACVQEG